jgi:hypothetical protein
VEEVMGQYFSIGLVCFFLLFMLIPISVSAQPHSVSIGYGFGLFSSSRGVGYIEGGHYDFIQCAYQYERSLSEILGLLVEPFASYTFSPRDGVDGGITLSLKYNLFKKQQNGFFLTAGGGAAYTSIKFEEQGTHLLFIIQGGIGYTWNDFFIENRFKHYSNANTASPNRAINSNLIMVGMYF